MTEEKYKFLVEWFDPCVKSKRRFVLGYYSDGSLDMYDIVCKKLFLRRTHCDTVDLSDLFIGSIINVLSRQLHVIEFADQWTAEKLGMDIELTVFIVNESGFKNLGVIITVLENNNLSLNRGKIIDREKSGFSTSSFAEKLGQRFLVLEIRGQNSRNIVRKLLNPETPIAKPLNGSLGELTEHCIGPMEDSTVEQEIKIFFPVYEEIHCNTACYENSTCCLLKPHALKEKIAGKIIQDIIEAGFTISALEVVSFNLGTASEFLEVYKGVVAEYEGMVGQLVAGPCIALEVTKHNSSNVFTEFRTLVGPLDPDIAKKLRSGTLRSNFGYDKIKNAVHCTDLPEDVLLELDYVFRILPALTS